MAAKEDERLGIIRMKRTIIQVIVYNGSDFIRICLNNGKEKPLSEFGYRNMGNGNIRNQSWCKICR